MYIKSMLKEELRGQKHLKRLYKAELKKLPKGKLAAQCSHASVDAALLTQKKDPKLVSRWRNQGMMKVILKVKDEKEIYEFKEMCKANKIVCAIITDAGRTVVEPGTVTCMGIGPDDEEKIDKLTGSLKLM